MQWGQIKVLFILSFLILDLYLLQQFLEKQQEAELGKITYSASEDIETVLENNDVTFAPDAIPKETPEVPILISEESKFSEEIISKMKTLEDEGEQIVSLPSGNVLKAQLEEPVEVTSENVLEQVNSVFPFSNQYSYWGWNKDNGVLLFFQKVNDRTVYFNKGGFLMVQVKNNKITGYIATLLAFSDSPGEDSEKEQMVDLIDSKRVVKQLYEEEKITSGDQVTKMTIGYHNSLNLAPGQESGPQVFGPTWKVTVNESENHFVYAIDGTIITIEEEDFIKEIEATYNLTKQISDLTANNQRSSGEIN
ncbi:two-component system regulatory protein YycI [Halobacillus yeomjeoni]|uniref:Two-component system regulatory protein YycI n=1 Tax=Halobacillus yeomjeoni TaxID=311194 RepID=A0A931HV74_9BACI|nr:two-component system regulatory protein YycI [Halobacillus yeomjeoni]MBH0230287.1 two-component system regulatory protein YycI [Halobacillus yeomjeoni]MCA0984858.1 two-component system regulatory protein YycI [Halobacillus yeomjeoni]